MTLLSVSNLTVRYKSSPRPVVDGLSFAIDRSESVGLVGVSGSGKTQTALALLGLLPDNAHSSGSVRYQGQEILGAGNKVLNAIRARRIAMVFQDPGAALNPYLRIGEQLRQIVIRHGMATGAAIDARGIAMLEKAGLPDPERQYQAYPHQLSGGMRQRVMIASALIAEPELLIADEPTTALDATVQVQVLSLLRELREEMGTALLLITHDLGVIAGNCERMLVLDEGRLLEEGTTKAVFASPAHERTRAMLDTARNAGGQAAELRDPERKPALEVSDLAVSYIEPRTDRLWGKTELVAVQALSMSVRPGETVAIVGESGSGKTSLARAILGLVQARSGRVCFFGRELSGLLEGRSNSDRKQMQLVFQDPVGSLNPAMRVHDAIAEPLQVHEPGMDREERDRRVTLMLERVSLDKKLLRRFPHELSGGQAQRVAIARALIIKPAVLICDEAVASLDGAVRQGVLTLLAEEQRRTALSIIFISHDLNVVRQISHRVLVMYMGQIFEAADSADLFAKPLHPYSRALIDAIPVPDPNVPPTKPPVLGEAPSMIYPPSGCVFHPRCQHAQDRCRTQAPKKEHIAGAIVACHRASELDLTITDSRQISIDAL